MKKTLVTIAVILLAVAALAQEQTGSASIKGQVRSQKKVKLVGALVELTASDTGKKWETKTDADGRFAFGGLAPGGYLVKATAAEMHPLAVRMKVQAAQTRKLDMRLGIKITAVEAMPGLMNSPHVQEKTAEKPAVLDGESLKVVKAFLQERFPGKGRLNLAPETFPMDLSIVREKCLDGLSFSTPKSLKVHLLPAELVKNGLKFASKKKQESINRRLSEGKRDNLLELSEVIFDDSGRFAVLTEGYVCGNVCALGELVVFEKVQGEWKTAKSRQCSQSVS